MSEYSPAGVHWADTGFHISLQAVEIDPWLARATARRPDAMALETPEERLTYRELLMAATRGAGRLVLRGAEPGDRVGIALPPGRAFVVAVHACLLLRARGPPPPAAARPRHARRPAALRARAQGPAARRRGAARRSAGRGRRRAV